MRSSPGSLQHQQLVDANDYRALNDKPSEGSKVWSYVFGIVMVAGIIAVLVGVFVTNASVHNLQDDNAMTQKLIQSLLDSKASDSVSYKFAVSKVPPVKDQHRRGTCWDFASVAILEHQYRLQGFAKGYLGENDYVQFSEQAYGNVLMDLCRNNPRCIFSGDQIAFNNTDGGEITLLWTLHKELANKVLPTSVCPYQWNAGTPETYRCDDMDKALSANPISFSIKSWSTLYDINKIKRQIRTSNHALGWSSALNGANFYTACPAGSSHPNCQDSTCVQCPLDKNFPTRCCIQTQISLAANMDGEFYKHHDLFQIGGHAMLLVGYNDEYVTKVDGFRGGFIIRNSWNATNSHSIAYFMQEISEADERFICPNAENPRNWYQCGGGVDNTTSQYADCTSQTTVLSAQYSIQPLRLSCQPTATQQKSFGQTFCDPADGKTFYTLSLTEMADDQHQICVLAVDSNKVATKLCLPPMFVDHIARVFAPAAGELNGRKNSPDFCGYYFFPYQLVTEGRAQFGNFFINDFDIEFTDSSYLKNKASNPKSNYDFLAASLKTQTPFPDFDNNAFPNHLLSSNSFASRAARALKSVMKYHLNRV